MGSRQQKVFIRQPETRLNVWLLSAVISLSQNKLLRTKNTPLIDTPHHKELARNRITETKKQG